MITCEIGDVVYVRQADCLEQLGPGVTAAMLRSWARRHGVAKINARGEVWYDLDAALEVELRTRRSGRGRPRGAADRATRKTRSISTDGADGG